MPVFSCGRSLYIDWRMVVVVGGGILHHVKEEGKCSGGGMSREKCPTIKGTTIRIVTVIKAIRN